MTVINERSLVALAHLPPALHAMTSICVLFQPKFVRLVPMNVIALRKSSVITSSLAKRTIPENLSQHGLFLSEIE